MMEGYFTRTLGMHRVYNSAFMNMLKKEENQKYRDTVKNTIKFDPQVLKRFVNFMNNPDEETAVAQFGKGDKYFGVCTLMITMPGLPMFGHGQIEGFEEKYGMEYTRAYRDEKPDQGLVDRHWHDIFPLLHKRYLFSGVENFLFYDVWNNGQVNENIFAYSNGAGAERTIVFYNNKYERAAGWIKQSCEYAVKTGSGENDIQMYTRSLAEGIGLTSGNDHFMIFREHKSGLWFVRKSDDIINQGMYVALNGFEYQVYLDVQQVTDTVEGKYAKLNELLAGSGVPDLEIAWEEYRYKDLYAALAKFATPELLESLHNLFTPVAVLKANKKTLPDLKTVFDSAREAALAYYEKESEFAFEAEQIREKQRLAEENEKKTKKHSKATGTQKEMRVSKKATESTPEDRFKSFCRQIEYLATTMTNAQGVKSTKDGTSVTRNKISDTAFKTTQENVLYSGLMNYDCAPEILSAFAIVSSAGRKNCLTWSYDRKLTELLGKADIKAPGMKETFRSLFFMMRVRDFNFGASSFAKSTYESAKLLVDGPYSDLLVGTNEFNGIKWFNKEKMESAMWFCLAAITMFSPRILREQIYRLYRTLIAAKESSEYQVEKFLTALNPNPKTSARKKTAVKEIKAEKETQEVKEDKKSAKGKVKKSASGSKSSKQK